MCVKVVLKLTSDQKDRKKTKRWRHTNRFLTNLRTKGDRAFRLQAPKLWNDLPADIREANTLTYFIPL